MFVSAYRSCTWIVALTPSRARKWKRCFRSVRKWSVRGLGGAGVWRCFVQPRGERMPATAYFGTGRRITISSGVMAATSKPSRATAFMAMLM